MIKMQPSRMRLLLTCLVLTTLATSQTWSATPATVIKLLVYPGQDVPMLDTNVLGEAFHDQYYMQSNPNNTPKPQIKPPSSSSQITILEEILNTILDEKKKKLGKLLSKTNDKGRRPNNYQPTYTYRDSLPTYTSTNSLPSPQSTLPTPVYLKYKDKPAYNNPETPIQVMPGTPQYTYISVNPPKPMYTARPLPVYGSNRFKPPLTVQQIFKDVLNAKKTMLYKLLNKNTKKPTIYPSQPTPYIVQYPVKFSPATPDLKLIPDIPNYSYKYGKLFKVIHISKLHSSPFTSVIAFACQPRSLKSYLSFYFEFFGFSPQHLIFHICYS
jgi:hypothetical protein